VRSGTVAVGWALLVAGCVNRPAPARPPPVAAAAPPAVVAAPAAEYAPPAAEVLVWYQARARELRAAEDNFDRRGIDAAVRRINDPSERAYLDSPHARDARVPLLGAAQALADAAGADRMYDVLLALSSESREAGDRRTERIADEKQRDLYARKGLSLRAARERLAELDAAVHGMQGGPASARPPLTDDLLLTASPAARRGSAATPDELPHDLHRRLDRPFAAR